MVQIKLKWNKEVYNEVQLDTTQGGAAFKEAVYKLTAVPKDRQKLMAKGAWTGTLKDDADLSSMTIKEGQQVLLMGSADVVAAPKEAVKFVEDMTVEEQALKGAIIPAGLINLGNTCYMNSTVECLRTMPELREALTQAQSINLATLLRATYNELDKAGSSIPPYSFVYHLRTNFPQFAEQTPQGRWMQQDAEEFYNTLTNAVQREVDRTPTPFSSLLGLSLEEQISCNETDQETSTKRLESVNKIVCNIQGGSGASTNIDHMHEGLKLGLEGTLEKFSPVLGRDAVWSRKQRIASLPRYICVQFMRFFWKTTPDSRDHTGLKCKILRAVTFPEVFDVYDLCSEALQLRLRANREETEKQYESDAIKRAKTSAEATPSSALPSVPSVSVSAGESKTEDVEMTEEEEEALALEQALQMSMGGETAETEKETPAVDPPAPPTDAEAKGEKDVKGSSSSGLQGPVEVGQGLPLGFTGHYELHAIVTHKGRSADSGHYIGWVRQAPGSAFWWCYNDDTVTEIGTEDIMKLGGGGDRDMAYLNFYRFRE